MTVLELILLLQKFPQDATATYEVRGGGSYPDSQYDIDEASVRYDKYSNSVCVNDSTY